MTLDHEYSDKVPHSFSTKNGANNALASPTLVLQPPAPGTSIQICDNLVLKATGEIWLLWSVRPLDVPNGLVDQTWSFDLVAFRQSSVDIDIEEWVHQLLWVLVLFCRQINESDFRICRGKPVSIGLRYKLYVNSKFRIHKLINGENNGRRICHY